MKMIKFFVTFFCICFVSHASSQTLSNGQSVNIDGSLGSVQYYSVNIPSETQDLAIEISGGSGDADLYVRYAAEPTAGNYDCRPYLWGNQESCSFGSPNTGTYYIMVVGYSAFSDVTLHVAYEESGSAPGNPSAGDNIDIVTYNIEWLGNPSAAGYNGSRTQQINAAASDIISGGGEIYALQEIGGSSTLNDLVSVLNNIDGSNNWSGAVSQPSASQSLAFVYQTSLVNSVSFQTLLTNASSYDFAGRYPYLMTASVSIGATTKLLRFVNLHLKCCSGSSNESRRANAMATLLDELDDAYRYDNVIVLGDLNVADEGGAYGEIADWGMYVDQDNDGVADFSHAAGSVSDQVYVPGNPDSDIDHILISNELRAAWDAIPSSERNTYLNTTVSDHSPVKTTLDLSLIGSMPPTPTPPLPSEYSVSYALSQSVGSTLTVVGVVTEGFNDIYALKMRDVNDAGEVIVVKLEPDQRSTWSPELNPSVIGQMIQVVGTRDTYASEPSLEYVSSIQ